MAEDTPQNSSPENKEEHSSSTYLAIAFRSLRMLVYRTLRIQDNADPNDTIESIKVDIDFKGYNVWILIFSILIASIGLNVNSGAVVIGAMLISPLMGPILGVGLSLGINDWSTMKRSLQNFAVMFTVSIITSTVYFLLTPLVDAQSELLARTRPTLLDVIVAFIGGLAGILAANRKIKNNVVPGVAIATALMPPLCTAGYGIATGQWGFFFGAFYLFLINSIFISLATFLTVRFLAFPVKDFVDPERAKRARRYVFAVLLLIIVPSGFTFYQVVSESYLTRRVDEFVQENIFYDGAELVKKDFIANEDDTHSLNLVFFGENIPLKVVDSWRKKLTNYNLENIQIKVVQPQSMEEMNSTEVNKLVDVFSKSQIELQTKEQTITQLRLALNQEMNMRLPIDQLMAELKVNHPRLHTIGMARMIELNEGEKDTLITTNLYWSLQDTLGLKPESEQISDWLKVRLNLDTVVVHNLIRIPQESAPKPKALGKMN
tara:strand:+ start:5902 stop:7371 length:1470 start_codon:yes stop_codon:yes gene_type:complete